MTLRHPLILCVSKPALRDQDDVARFDIDVGRNIAAFGQVPQPNAVLPAPFRRPQDRCFVAVSKIGQTAVESLADFAAAMKDVSLKDGVLLLVKVGEASRFVVIRA